MRTLVGPLRGKRIAPGTDDVRDSPGLDVADRLARDGAEIVVYGPRVTPNALVEFPHLHDHGLLPANIAANNT